jgi:hypothetical protein
MKREKLDEKPLLTGLDELGDLEHGLAIGKAQVNDAVGPYGWSKQLDTDRYLVARSSGVSGPSHVIAMCDDRAMAAKLVVLLNQAHHRVTKCHDQIRTLLSNAFHGGTV